MAVQHLKMLGGSQNFYPHFGFEYPAFRNKGKLLFGVYF